MHSAVNLQPLNDKLERLSQGAQGMGMGMGKGAGDRGRRGRGGAGAEVDHGESFEDCVAACGCGGGDGADCCVVRRGVEWRSEGWNGYRRDVEWLEWEGRD